MTQRIAIKISYYTLLLGNHADASAVIAGLNGATLVESSGYGRELRYRETDKESIELLLIPEELIGSAPAQIEAYVEDLKHANERYANEAKARTAAEKELKELKEKFAPFLESAETENKKAEV